VGNPVLLKGIFQGSGDVILPNDIREALRTVFAREYLVAHGEN
jgi:hypothetical protein